MAAALTGAVALSSTGPYPGHRKRETATVPNPISSIPSLADIQSFQVNRTGQYEAVRQSLYDTITYANAGTTTQYTFFQVPKGQSGKTLAQTNLTLAGTLAAPINFFVQSIELLIFPGVLPATSVTTNASPNFTNDIYTLQKAGFLDFFIGSKSYLQEAPIGRFPPKTHLHGWAAESSGNSTATTLFRTSIESAAFGGRPYFIDPGILLAPTQNFNVTINFPTTTALPSATDATIVCILDGILYRLSQ